MRRAALRFPHCTQMRISVSNSIESGSPQCGHLLSYRFFLALGHVKKRMINNFHGFIFIHRNNDPLGFPVIEEGNSFPPVQGFKDLAHFIPKINDRCFHGVSIMCITSLYIFFVTCQEITSDEERVSRDKIKESDQWPVISNQKVKSDEERVSRAKNEL
jgi:hypothetical protein